MKSSLTDLAKTDPNDFKKDSDVKRYEAKKNYTEGEAAAFKEIQAYKVISGVSILILYLYTLYVTAQISPATDTNSKLNIDALNLIIGLHGFFLGVYTAKIIPRNAHRTNNAMLISMVGISLVVYQVIMLLMKVKVIATGVSGLDSSIVFIAHCILSVAIAWPLTRLLLRITSPKKPVHIDSRSIGTKFFEGKLRGALWRKCRKMQLTKELSKKLNI